MRSLAVPLAAYLLVAVALPALNGAAARPGFAEHCLTIAVVCGAIAAVFVSIAHLARRRRS